jgi:hypothetical protein
MEEIFYSEKGKDFKEQEKEFQEQEREFQEQEQERKYCNRNGIRNI